VLKTSKSELFFVVIHDRKHTVSYSRECI